MTEATNTGILLAVEWLDSWDAHDLLERLTGSRISVYDLIMVIQAQKVPVYANHEMITLRPVYTEDYPELEAEGWGLLEPWREPIKRVSRGGVISALRDGKHQGTFLAVCSVTLLDTRSPLVHERKDGQLEIWAIVPDWPEGFEYLREAWRFHMPAYFKPADIQRLANIINGTEQRTADGAEVEQLRQRIAELEAENTALKAGPSPKARNAYLRTIAAMGNALVGGLTGKHHTDAEAILSVLASKGIAEPVGKAALSDYLKEAYKIKY